MTASIGNYCTNLFTLIKENPEAKMDIVLLVGMIIMAIGILIAPQPFLPHAFSTPHQFLVFVGILTFSGVTLTKVSVLAFKAWFLAQP